MSAGDLPQPIEETQIAIEREDLLIEVGAKRADVRATLRLANRGDDAKITVGFPCDTTEYAGAHGLECKTRITVIADGKPLAVKLKKAGAKGKHWIWPMRFSAGQTVTLDVRYRTRLINDRYSTPVRGMGTLYYRLATGANWAGPIEELNMEVRLPTDVIVHVAPTGGRRDVGRITWKLTSYEPNEDLAILFDPTRLGRYAKVLGDRVDSYAALKKAVAGGAFSAAELQGMAKDFRDALPEHLQWAEFFQGVARAKLGLPAPKPDEIRTCVEESAKIMEAIAKKGNK